MIVDILYMICYTLMPEFELVLEVEVAWIILHCAHLEWLLFLSILLATIILLQEGHDECEPSHVSIHAHVEGVATLRKCAELVAVDELGQADCAFGEFSVG